MKGEEIALIVVQAKRAALGAHTALLVETDKNGPKYVAFGKQGAAAHEWPIVTLLQGKDPGQAPNRFIATTVAPNEAEIGMAWKYGIDRIIFWQDPAGSQIKITNDGSKFAAVTLTLSGEDLKFWTQPAPVPGFPKPLTDTAASAWIKAFDRKTLTTAGTRAKEASAKDVYGSRAAVPDAISRDLVLTPGLGLAKPAFADMVFMHLAYALVSAGWRTSEKEDKGGYNIGSILVDSTQRIVAWGLNLVAENKSFHAETAMIQAYLKKKGATQLPASCTMYTSLESCHMCAGFAAEVGNGLRVIYGQKDDQILNNALERKVKASSQAPTTTRFNPSGVPTRLATPIASGAKPGLAPGASMDVISRLRNEFKELDKFTGVTKFLFSDLGKYFYDIEQKVPGTTVGRLGEIAKAPNLPKPTPAPYRPGFLDPVRVTPTPSPLAHLDLAMPRREPRPEDREAMNRKLFGAEMDLARYALQFLDTLRKQGVFG